MTFRDQRQWVALAVLVAGVLGAIFLFYPSRRVDLVVEFREASRCREGTLSVVLARETSASPDHSMSIALDRPSLVLPWVVSVRPEPHVLLPAIDFRGVRHMLPKQTWDGRSAPSIVVNVGRACLELER